MISFLSEVIKLREERKKNFLKLWANSYTAGLIYGSFNYDNSFRSLHCSFSWMRPRYVLGSLSNSLQKSNQQKSVWIKRKRPITHPNLCISAISCSNRRKHELKDNKKMDLGIEKNKQLSFANYPTCLCIAESRIVFTVF